MPVTILNGLTRGKGLAIRRLMNYRDNKPMVPLVISTLTQDKCCTEIKTKFYDSLRKRKNWDVISGKKYTDSFGVGYVMRSFQGGPTKLRIPVSDVLPGFCDRQS